MAGLETVIGKNIRELRKHLEITQEDLAQETGFSSSQIISQIENGQREVKAWELFNIAKVLHSSINELLSEHMTGHLSFVLWRKTPLIDRKKLEAEFLKRCKQYHQLEQLCNIRAEYELPKHTVDFETMSFGEAGRLGKKIWKELELGSRPASCLANVLENKYAVKIWFQDLGGEGSAASARGDFGDGILMNSREVPWRRNYSFGHELFHLITWDSITPDSLARNKTEFGEHIEKLAEAFSSSLLLPEDEITQAWENWRHGSNTTVNDIVALARDFEVSTSALLWRLCNLGYIESEDVNHLLEDEEFRTLDKVLRAKSAESVQTRIPDRFVRLGFVAYQRGNLSRSLFAEYLGLNIVDLPQFLLEYGLDDTKNYETQISTARHDGNNRILSA
jgi:Zn-dependent peptidase ImmA (M78 family)/transcriptional regulator with XRE-family HTH domain